MIVVVTAQITFFVETLSEYWVLAEVRTIYILRLDPNLCHIVSSVAKAQKLSLHTSIVSGVRAFEEI